MKKVVLLDIDGVLNPLGRNSGDGIAFKTSEGFNVFVPNEINNFLHRLESSDVEVIWMTSWQEEVRLFEYMLKLKPKEYLEINFSRLIEGLHKQDTVEYYVSNNPDKDTLVIDDQLQNNIWQNVHCIIPERESGLDKHDVDAIFAWINIKRE